jgi:hypothetical protein
LQLLFLGFFGAQAHDALKKHIHDPIVVLAGPDVPFNKGLSKLAKKEVLTEVPFEIKPSEEPLILLKKKDNRIKGYGPITCKGGFFGETCTSWTRSYESQ